MLNTESRTRVICHLPFNTSAQEVALHRVISFVKRQKDSDCGVTGYTYSDGFKGGWWSAERDKWVKDRIVILMIDYKVDLDDEVVALLQHIEKLKKRITRHYRVKGMPDEDEFWIVSESMTRYL